MRLSLFCITVVCYISIFGQCPPGELGKGQFLPTPAGCATFGLDITYQPIYANLDDNAQIVIDWGDGTQNTIINVGSTGSQDGIDYNTPSPHTYTEENTSAGCVYTISSYVISNCYTIEETTVQEEIVVWNTDNYGDGDSDLTPSPTLYKVCAGTTAVVDFEDLSPWNCTDLMVTTSVNDKPRWTQWIYGSFNNITGAVTVNGNDEAPYPYDGAIEEHLGSQVLNPVAPGNESLEVAIPATAQVGEEFHVRLNNWNQCNPYEDAAGDLTGNTPVFRDAIIRIVAPPSPNFQTHLGDGGGPVQTTFCLGQEIFFENLTTGGNSYFWEFFDDSTGSQLLGTQTMTNPTYAWGTPGTKMIRLTATNTNVAGCSIVMEGTIEISPDAIAKIEFFDSTFQSIVTPSFCQDDTSIFYVGLRDATTNIEPATSWRWEFYDEQGQLIGSLPPDMDTYTPTQQPDTVLAFSSPGYTVVRLIARNSLTLCETVDEDTIFVYKAPEPFFEASSVCEGAPTSFFSIGAGAGPWINGDSVAMYEWDFSFDGAFSSDTIMTSGIFFERFLSDNGAMEPLSSVAGQYPVGLRITTSQGSCLAIYQDNVEVWPLPEAVISLSTESICPGEAVSIENMSYDPSFQVSYEVLIRHDSSNYEQTIPLMSTDTTMVIGNADDSVRTYRVELLAISANGCQQVSPPRSLQVLPDEDAHFIDLNYSFISSNCSPWQSTLQTDEATQGLDPDAYTWIITDAHGEVLDGYPVTKVRGDTNYHQLDYEIINTGPTNATYQIVLTTTKAGLCIANDTFNVQVSPQPTAEFARQRVDECDEVHFQLEAQQKGLQYAWEFQPPPNSLFDDGDVQYATYTRPEMAEGSLLVVFALETSNLADCSSGSVAEEVTVHSKSVDVTALFTLSDDTVKLPEADVGLTNLSSMDAIYHWSFGDGDSSTLYSPGFHSYDAPGQYQIILTVSTPICDQTFSRMVTVLHPDQVIDFEATPLEGCSPLTVKFTNNSSGALPGKYVWEFGDGSISQADEPTHTYFQGGVYTVRLRGENDRGEAGQKERSEYIHVFQSPKADFLATPQVVYIPDQPVLFRNLSSDADTYDWDFGDGESSHLSEPRHTYNEEGLYNIQLVASNELGCADTLLRQADVEAIRGGSAVTPNAFTPSLSGPTGGEVGMMGHSDLSRINDIFLPKVEGVSKFRMLVYNKWGQLLFESQSQYRGWDGYYRGELSPAGVYVYRLDLTYSDGREEIKAGDLTLIR